MSIESALREFREIQERFLPSDNSKVQAADKHEPDQEDAAPESNSKDISSDGEPKEIDDIGGETSEAIADALDMLLSVVQASTERIKSIINQIVADESIELNEVLTSDVIDKLGAAISDLSEIESDIATMGDDEEEEIEDLVDEPDELDGEIVPGDEQKTHQGE